MLLTAVSGYVLTVAVLGTAGWDALATLRGPTTASFEDLLAATATAAAWVCLGWLTAGVVLTVLASLPATARPAVTRAALRIAPPTLRRATGVLLGAALVGVPAPLATASGPSPTVEGPAGFAAPRFETLPDPDRPAAGPAPRPGTVPEAVPLLGSRVEVRPGDTLWGLAAAELGPGATAGAVARRWPRWYAANRTNIGTDPDLILPGQQLRRPPVDNAGPRERRARSQTDPGADTSA
jgi:nucleoid-associated protein YgaU